MGGVAGDVAPHPNLDPAAAPHATASGVEAVTTRDQGLALQAVTAGADQGLEDETRRKRRRNRGASRRRTRAGTSRAPGTARPPLGISLVLGKSLGPDLRPLGRPSSLQTTVDCDASSKRHHVVRRNYRGYCQVATNIPVITVLSVCVEFL